MGEGQKWYSNGKLLITGEYLVMENALAFALPLKQGQSLEVQQTAATAGQINWQALRTDGSWFSAVLQTSNFDILQTDNGELAKALQKILMAVRVLSPSFLTDYAAYNVRTRLDFKPEFGFGSSSTFISNLAWWAKINPYELLQLTFGGSGYDIACARTNSAVFFKLGKADPLVEKIHFQPQFKNNLFFVYLGQKQKSTESIKSFKQSAVFGKKEIERISHISRQTASTTTLTEFEELLDEHEQIMSTVLGRPTIKSLLFSDLKGTVKSLGGWGGDFVLITSELSKPDFKAKMTDRGFNTLFDFDELVL